MFKSPTIHVYSLFNCLLSFFNSAVKNGLSRTGLIFTVFRGNIASSFSFTCFSNVHTWSVGLPFSGILSHSSEQIHSPNSKIPGKVRGGKS